MSSDCCGGKEKLSKHLLLRRDGFLSMQNAVNEFDALGYKVKGYYPNFESSAVDGSGPIWYASLELDNGGYENVTNLRDVPPEEVDSHIIQGWEIASASISTKFVRMVKRNKQ